LDLILSSHFSRNEPGAFEALRDALLLHGDSYRPLADLRSYLEAVERLTRRYADQDAWHGWPSGTRPVQETRECHRIRPKGCNSSMR
jgi:glucan phosphorylase